MDESQIHQLHSLLSKSKRIAIVSHKNPDGDALGSSLALAQVLTKLGHITSVIMPNAQPKFLQWLPGSDSILQYEKDTESIDALLSEVDIVFTLDFNSLSRIGGLQQPLENLHKNGVPFIMIDHHQAPDDYAVVTYSDVQMSSTAQMVYHFIEALGWLSYIDASIATCIYTGILTDTGSFKYRSTTAATHRVVADLLDAGAINWEINTLIFDTNSENRLKLLSTALNNLVVLPEYNTAYITLTQAELDSHNFQKGDTEGFVNYALSIENINLALIFIESASEEIIKISLRSKGDFSVNEMSRKHFNGGGHNNAAGGRSLNNMEDTVSYFRKILADYKNDLTND